jgi:hypothetical protein
MSLVCEAMLVPELVTLFDPELVVPSDDSLRELEFWQRLYAWSLDARPHMGRATYQGFIEVVGTDFSVTGLSPAEYWEIVKRLVSRIAETGDSAERVVDDHLSSVYVPALGASDNQSRLASDISLIRPQLGVIVATDSQCWSHDCVAGTCGRCGEARLYLTTAPAADLARISRAEFLLGNPAPSQIEGVAHTLFPQLDFAPSAWSGLDLLHGEPRKIAGDLVHHLGILNDYAAEVWTSSAQANVRQQQLASHGVVASPESPKVHKSTKAMKARKFTFGAMEVSCEWHTKLKPHTDRIYFAVAGDRVMIGAITDHLPAN